MACVHPDHSNGPQPDGAVYRMCLAHYAGRCACSLSQEGAYRDMQSLPACAGQHKSPFGLCVPVEASDATHIQLNEAG